jgi:hypothetical protein
MAQATSQTGKRTNKRGLSWTLFVGFIAVTILLVVMIWVDNFTGQENSSTPGYYRDTFIVDESVHARATAEAEQDLILTPAP